MMGLVRHSPALTPSSFLPSLMPQSCSFWLLGCREEGEGEEAFLLQPAWLHRVFERKMCALVVAFMDLYTLFFEIPRGITKNEKALFFLGKEFFRAICTYNATYASTRQ